MLILNKENILKNNQIQSIVNLLGHNFAPRKIVVYEKFIEDLRDDFDNLIPTIGGYVYNKTTLEIRDGKYDKFSDIAYLDTYTQGKTRHSKQLYSIHGLIGLLYVGKQFREQEISNCEDEAIEFATEFVNKHSEEISKIMGWKDEWEIEIES
ncbi:hypothetical protein ACR77J_07640 [Tissierella praeacuta]|uniref:hypothetical protein n=1 Tax=Tissierella praeacuta TaxID=43131 RepID=UPI003DA51211